MPAFAGVKLVQRTCRRWVARPTDDLDWLRDIDLVSCPTDSPSECILRSSRQLAWGRQPGEAIKALLRNLDPGEWPPQVSATLFDFSGPAAIVEDPDAESSLLSVMEVSPLWEEIRDSALERRLGLIHLPQTGCAIVPELALRSSGARLEEVADCRESTFVPGLAFSDN